jgi:hypothetical protein
VPRDAGIALARGDVVAYLDDDNTWAPDHVSTVVAAMLRADASFAFSSMRADGRDLHFRRPERQGIDTSTIVHRRDLFARHGGWRDRQHDYAHDWELVSRWARGRRAVGMHANGHGGLRHDPERAVGVHGSARRTPRERSRSEREARRGAPGRGRGSRRSPLRRRGALGGAARGACPSRAARRARGRRHVEPRAIRDVVGEPPFRWRGAWWRVAAPSRDGAPAARHLVRLDERLREVATFPLRGYGSPFDATCWMPIVEGDRLRFVYSLGPTIVVDASAGDGTIVVERGADPGAAIDHWRGGVAPLAIEGGALAVVHEGERGARAHRFVVLDDALMLVAASEPFRFRPTGDEIVTGIDPDPGGARVRVRLAGASGGVVSIALAEVRAMLRPFPPARGGR